MAAISGVLYFIGYAGFEQFYLSYIALVPFLLALRGAPSWKQTVLISFTGGFVTQFGGFYWVAHVVHNYGHFNWGIAILFCVLLCAYQALQIVLWALLLRQAGRSLPWGWAALIVWMAVEFTWPMLFPNYYGNSQYRFTTLVQIADLGGVLLVSALVVAINSGLYETLAHWLTGRRRLAAINLAVVVGLFASAVAYGLFRVPQVESRMAFARKLKVSLVQANLWLDRKGKSPAEDVRTHRELSQSAEEQGAQLIVWPETSFPYRIHDGARDLQAAVLDYLRTPHILGASTLVKEGGRRWLRNSGYLINGQGQVQGRYDKQYLLAFGEYLPFGQDFPWLYSLSPYSGRYTRGTSNQAVRIGDLVLGINICYEDIISSHIHTLMQGYPHLLVNITNDAWFGETNEPLIHLALATFRCVEHHRAMARGTNTGISAFIDPLGRIMEQSRINEQALLIRDLPLMEGRTVFGATGQWVGWLALLGMGATLLAARRRR